MSEPLSISRLRELIRAQEAWLNQAEEPSYQDSLDIYRALGEYALLLEAQPGVH